MPPCKAVFLFGTAALRMRFTFGKYLADRLITCCSQSVQILPMAGCPQILQVFSAFASPLYGNFAMILSANSATTIKIQGYLLAIIMYGHYFPAHYDVAKLHVLNVYLCSFQISHLLSGKLFLYETEKYKSANINLSP